MVRIKPQGFAELGDSLRLFAEAEILKTDEIALVHLPPLLSRSSSKIRKSGSETAK